MDMLHGGTDVEVEDIPVLLSVRNRSSDGLRNKRSMGFQPIVESVANAPEGDPKILAAFQKEVN
jgi:hypothetical protein